MKKFIILILLLISFICISGCSNDNKKTIWNMEYIQGKDGKVIYCSNENKDLFSSAKIKNIVCILQGSSIAITDKDTGEEMFGKCNVIDIDNKSTLYEVIFDDDKKGHLVKSFTKYADNTQHDTLIVSYEDNSLTFSKGNIN